MVPPSGRREELQKELREAQAKPPPKTQAQLLIETKMGGLSWFRKHQKNTPKWIEMAIPSTRQLCDRTPGESNVPWHSSMLMDNSTHTHTHTHTRNDGQSLRREDSASTRGPGRQSEIRKTIHSKNLEIYTLVN